MKIFINKMIAILTIAAVCVGAYGIGVAVDGNEVYAAQYDALNNFKTAGDYIDISTDTSGKESLAAQLPERSHVVAVSGTYNIQIWTPKGEDSVQQNYSKKRGWEDSNTVYGTSGQYLNVNVKISKGSKLATVGNLEEGIGIRGIIQLAGGNGANLGTRSLSGDNTRYTIESTRGYFGGNGGNGYQGAYGGRGSKGGSGYCGGDGGQGCTSSGTDESNKGALGGDGFIPGNGGEHKGLFSAGQYSDKGTTYQSTKPSPIGQIPAGTVKYRTGGAFPSFSTSEYNGTDGRIRIQLVTAENVGTNEGIISVEVTEASTWEAMIQMGSAMDRIATAMENGKVGGSGGGNSATTPVQSSVATVVKGKSFDIYIPVESTKAGNTVVGTVTVINNDVKDGLLQLVGRIDTAGNKEIVVGDTKFVLQTVEEPDSTNVTAILK